MAEKEIKSGKKPFNVKEIFKSGIKQISGDVDSRTGNFFLIAVIIILINVAGAFFSMRFDLTQSGAFSLSPVSKKAVRSLEEPLIVKVFFSSDLPAPYNGTQRYVLDLLEEYNNASGSNFRIEVENVDDEKGKQVAASYGVSPVQVREVASDQVKQRATYMGLVLIHGDLVEKMNEVTSPEGLEYKITGIIRKMVGKNDALLAVKQPIKVTLYVSDELKNFGIQGFEKLSDTVREGFEKVNATNYKKLVYNAVDPSADKSTEAIARRYGLQTLKWKDTNLPGGKHLPAGEGILSIVVQNGDRFQVIPLQIQPTIFGRYVIGGLEQVNDRINAAVSMVLAHNPTVGYASGNAERSLADEREGAANLRALLMEEYDVKEFDLTKDEIPESVKTLIVNGPKVAYTDEELYKIDQFMMKGGNVLFLVDSFNEMRTQSRNPMQQSAFVPIDSGLGKILSKLGIAVNKDYVLDQKCFVQRGENGDTPIYFIPVIEKKSLSKDSPITRYMNKMIFLKASTLTINADE
ncbi:MAG TPA: GldG family protein, partial [Spirochaetota bacterium]